jgi:hypothetical protein
MANFPSRLISSRTILIQGSSLLPIWSVKGQSLLAVTETGGVRLSGLRSAVRPHRAKLAVSLPGKALPPWQHTNFNRPFTTP